MFVFSLYDCVWNAKAAAAALPPTSLSPTPVNETVIAPVMEPVAEPVAAAVEASLNPLTSESAPPSATV